ncbi:hypothetical protein RKD28_007226 [Streptomyces sp. SAI-229]|jgi:hypothetical protein
MDRHRTETWWDATPTAAVGVTCGPCELVVIDVDAHAAPVPSRDRLLPGVPVPDPVDPDGPASGFDPLAPPTAFHGRPGPAHDAHTPRVRTPSGGLHVRYRNPRPDVRLRHSTGSGGRTAPARQADVRADGGYVVAPGTHNDQGVHRAEGPVRAPAPLPERLRDEPVRTPHLVAPAALSRVRPAAVPRPVRFRNSGSACRVLDPLIARVAQCASASEGTAFTEKPDRSARTAGGPVAAGRLAHGSVRDRLIRVAHHARPRQTARNEAIVDDALAAGAGLSLHLEGPS